MSFDLYLSYSGRKTYLTCPKRYWFRYVKEDPATDDPRDSMFGSSIGKIFEWFYSDQLWAHPDPLKSVQDRIEPAMQDVFAKEGFDPVTDPGFCTILRQELIHYVPIGLELIRSQGFLTPYSQAEYNLAVTYGDERRGMTIRLGGRADFVHSQDRRDVWIVDGKASKHREKYADAEQLIWYAVQHYIKHHVAPSRLGFLFYRFPDDPVSWITFDGNSMRASLDKTFEVAKKIQLKMFDPTPSNECKRCPYKPKCDEGTRYVAKKKSDDSMSFEDSVLSPELI